MSVMTKVLGAPLRGRGHLYEDFSVGQKFDHHWGRTITEQDAILFSTLTLSYNPLYFNRAFAMKEGHPNFVVNPQLVFNVTLGLAVEDCSEIGGPFLGVFDLTYDKPVYPGATLVARSETLDCRISESNPANGIVTWRTEGFDETGDRVVGFRRSNLVRLRNQPGASA